MVSFNKLMMMMMMMMMNDGEVDVAKSDRETVPQTWSSDSEGAITETSASALNDTRILTSDDRS